MSAYALALIMDRHLIIDLPTPCRLEYSLQPNEVNWLLSNIESNYSHLTKYHFYINYNDNLILEKNFLKFKRHKDVIIVRTGLNLIRHLTLNPEHHTKIKSLGYSVDTFNLENVFYDWYKKLFKFKAHLEPIYQNMLKISKPTNQTKLICAQIRVGGGFDTQFMLPNQVKLFWKQIRHNFITLHGLVDYRIFITTDKSSVVGEAVKEFGDEKVIGFKDRSFHISNEYNLLPFLKKNTCDKVGGLYLDFYMLGICEMGVISHSGFGLVGILNRENKLDLANFYVFTNPTEKKKNFVSNKELSFHQFNISLLYIEYRNLNEKWPKI